jgi:hypothetical protein
MFVFSLPAVLNRLRTTVGKAGRAGEKTIDAGRMLHRINV